MYDIAPVHIPSLTHSPTHCSSSVTLYVYGSSTYGSVAPWLSGIYIYIYICAVCRKEGAKGFFRGLLPNCVKVAPSAAVTFLVYEESLKLLRRYHIGYK
jgi:hypothetical protein